MTAPLTGRTAELDRIRTLGRTITVDRRPSVLLIVGEPGLGKSRLLEEARSAIAVRRSLGVVGYEPERGVPLAAAAELLRTLVRTDPGGRLSELLGESTRTGALEPIRVFEAALQAVERQAPLLILVDDLQWVDELSLALCHYLLRAAVSSQRAIGLLAMSRPSPVVGTFSDAFRRVFADSDQFAVAELEPLGREDGIQLVRALAPDLRTTQAAQLWAQAAGSPFWLSVLATGPGDRPADRVIDLRLRYAAPDAAELIAVLAVAGRPASFDEIATIEGWPEDRVIAALDELVAGGLATRGGATAALVHDLVRDAAARGLSESTCRRLHQAWATTLEDLAADDLGMLRSALEHRRAAGMPSVGLALRLAGSPRRRWSGRDGLALIGAIADEAEPSDGEAQEIRVATATLAAELGEDRVAYERWTLIAERAPAGPDRQRALLGAARAAYELDEGSLSRLAIDRARAGAATSADLIALDALEAEVIIWLQGRPTEGWPLARQAAEAARRLVDAAGGADRLPDDQRRAVVDAFKVAWQAAVQDDQWRVLGDLTDAFVDAANGIDAAAVIRAMSAAGTAALIRGDYRGSLTIQRRAWDESRRRLYPSLAAGAGFPFAHMLMETGQIGAATQIVRETLDLVDRVGTRGRLLSRSQYVAYDLAFHTGDRRTAVDELARSAASVGPHYAISAHERLATWTAILDGPTAATEVVAHIEAGRACATLAGCPRCGLELELWAARALAWVGRSSEARHTIDAWDAVRPDPNPDDALTRGWVEGLLADEPGMAHDRLSAVLTEAEGQGRAIDSIVLQLDLGRVVSATDRSGAEAYLSAALSGAREAGSVALQRIADRALRDLGVRTWRRGPADRQTRTSTGTPADFALSPREIEVARLVIEGASNPEIAAQLFLSRKTVERHVSNALAKAGARNRTELAHRLRDVDALD